MNASAIPETVSDVAEPNNTTEAGLLRTELMNCMNHVATYRNGNTQLIEALMRCVQGQSFGVSVLVECGMANASDGTLNWEALEARKDARWSWRDAVTMLVKNPEHAATLLLMHECDQNLPFGGPELLHIARTLCAGIEQLPASEHATKLSAGAGGVAHALQELQANGDYFWPERASDAVSTDASA